eukprot:SAG22_NODE_4311_length_1308_cov_1.614557_1_plen_263_part_01
MVAMCCLQLSGASVAPDAQLPRLMHPPMGWMAWESFRTGVSEALVRNTTDIMVRDGWLAAGYDTVHIDDGWTAQRRDSRGRIVADSAKFPSGMAALSDYVHERGMRLGIYSSASARTCAGFIGSEGREAQDARVLENWKTDYLKMDACNNGLSGPPAAAARAASYRAMGAALKHADIVFSCSWGTKNGSFAEMIDAGCDTWRLWHDIEAKKDWNEVPRISGHWAEIAATLLPWSGRPPSKGYHDPDQLIGGDPQYSLVESQSQ